MPAWYVRTQSEEEVIRVIKEQLDDDLAALEKRKGNVDELVSLLGKWLPSINTSSARTRGMARKLADLLGMKHCT